MKNEKQGALEDKINTLNQTIQNLVKQLAEKNDMSIKSISRFNDNSSENDPNMRFLDDRFAETSSSIVRGDSDSIADRILEKNPEFANRIKNIEKEIEEN